MEQMSARPDMVEMIKSAKDREDLELLFFERFEVDVRVKTVAAPSHGEPRKLREAREFALKHGGLRLKDGSVFVGLKVFDTVPL